MPLAMLPSPLFATLILRFTPSRLNTAFTKTDFHRYADLRVVTRATRREVADYAISCHRHFHCQQFRRRC